LTTQQVLGRCRTIRARKYTVRIETEPDMTMLCGVFAGIQTARRAGTTHVPWSVRTVITPRFA
jgi:hypothetical protein